jgi:hypothetical protein
MTLNHLLAKSQERNPFLGRNFFGDRISHDNGTLVVQRSPKITTPVTVVASLFTPICSGSRNSTACAAKAISVSSP